MDLETVLKAVEAAAVPYVADASDAALRAANAMPAEAPDFDRGIAAGMALARYFDQSTPVRTAA